MNKSTTELLIEIHTDMKWIKGSIQDLKYSTASVKKLALAAKDLAIKNEQEISSFKTMVKIGGSIITFILGTLTFFKDKLGG